MKKTIAIIALVAIALSSAHCQEVIHGSVRDDETKQGIPCAAIHLKDTYIGTACNESGQFILHVPRGKEKAKVIVSSLGYLSDTISVQALIKKKGRVNLKPNTVQLSDVTVVEFASAKRLIDAVIEHIPQNYRTEDAVGIWHHRNRQMVNDSLFVESEGLIRNYMPPYGKMLSLSLYYGQDSSEWNEDL